VSARHLHAPAGPIFYSPPLPRVGELVTGDPEQPSSCASRLRSNRSSRFERGGEDLGREVRGNVGPAGCTPEEPEKLRLKPFVEDSERFGVARGERQQFGVVGP
jgi:hypothetical protein